MIFTAWESSDGEEVCFVEGEGPPHFADGTPIPDYPERIHVVFADSWEEAKAIYHDLQGWEPYRPVEE
jgi:hypothetical protein